MSLLIKALEQAAKDRDSAKAAGDAAATPAPTAEPTLEPPPPPRSVPSLDSVPRERSAATEPPDFARGQPSLDPAGIAQPAARARPSPAAPEANAPRNRPLPDEVEAGAPRPRASFDDAEANAVRARAPHAPGEPRTPVTRAPAAPIARKPAPAEPTLSPRSTASPAATIAAASIGGGIGRKATAAPALGTDAAARRAQQTSASLDEIDAQQRNRARAATVMQASGGVAGNAITYLRGNPIAAIGALALLCGLGYGVYVYLQISNPGLFVRQAAKQPEQPPVVAPPAPASPAASASAPTAEAMPGIPAGPASAPSAAAPVPPAMPESAAAAPAAPSGSSGAISASSVIGSPHVAETPRGAPRAERLAEAPRERGSIAGGSETPKAAPAAATARSAAIPMEPQSRERIAVTPATVQPRMNPALGEAYSALQSGNTETARTQYSRVLQSEPQNVDAMLGLAYIAAQENRTDDAMRFYTRILQLNPRHPQAQAAMIGLVGRAEPVASETRLKQLIAREPSAFLHFVLGNLYADQSLWAQAQQSYFQAHHLEPTNPDYAYNLAIGLDHIGQSKPALNFYRLAEQLASSSGRANFSVTHARERIGALSSQLD